MPSKENLNQLKIMSGAIIRDFQGISPKLFKNIFIAEGAVVIGDVEIGEGTNIWYNVTVRGDVNHIRIGENTNIQDNTVCHVTYKTHPLIIGSNVTVGHSAILHGCTLEDSSFIGMGSIIMDGAVVESGAMVAAGAMVTPNKIVKSGELWSGRPAKLMREMTQDEKDFIALSSKHYRELASKY